MFKWIWTQMSCSISFNKQSHYTLWSAMDILHAYLCITVQIHTKTELHFQQELFPHTIGLPAMRNSLPSELRSAASLHSFKKDTNPTCPELFQPSFQEYIIHYIKWKQTITVLVSLKLFGGRALQVLFMARIHTLTTVKTPDLASCGTKGDPPNIISCPPP